MLWLAVTADKYELPIAVAGTAAELAKMLGVKTHTIIRKVYEHKTGKSKTWLNYKIVKVPEEDEDERNIIQS